MKSSPIIVLLVFLALSIVANAHQVILNPSQDATVVSYQPNNNYGNDDTLWIGHTNGAWLFSLIQFDLSSYSGVIVESAYLKLYVYRPQGTFPPINMWVGLLVGIWDEMTVTWNNMPGLQYYVLVSGPNSVPAWWVIDARTIVNDWVRGTFNNNGFMLGTQDANDDFLNIYSREYSDPDLHPKLELNYHDVSVQPTSVGSIKAIYK